MHPWLSSQRANQSRSVASQLAEAVGLAEAIRLDICEALSLPVRSIRPATYINAGQVDVLRDTVEAEQITLVIVNTALTPSQQRNLERALKCKVIDRTALILEIFGERAQTREGMLQVELAALNYQKSRLVRSWTHLERQRGGAGFMGGPGESQIELDRRIIADKIILLKKQLEKVVRTRTLHRKKRHDVPYPLVALVGYTNAGKSTLFNRLSGADVMAEDMLFATLDPTIREVAMPGGRRILLSDTVGFISNLPHELVAAFRATLEEVQEADLIVHVRDMSHPESDAQHDDVMEVLGDLLGKALGDKPVIEAWNKIDNISDMGELPQPDDTQICISALTGDGLPALLNLIATRLASALYETHDYAIPSSDGKAIAWLHAHGQVTRKQHDAEGICHIRAALSHSDVARFSTLHHYRPEGVSIKKNSG